MCICNFASISFIYLYHLFIYHIFIIHIIYLFKSFIYLYHLFIYIIYLFISFIYLSYIYYSYHLFLLLSPRHSLSNTYPPASPTCQPGFELTGGWGLTPQFPCSFHCDPLNSLVPAVLPTLPVHFSQFEPCCQLPTLLPTIFGLSFLCSLSWYCGGYVYPTVSSLCSLFLFVPRIVDKLFHERQFKTFFFQCQDPPRIKRSSGFFLRPRSARSCLVETGRPYSYLPQRRRKVLHRPLPD